jgi:hypothetical protein
MCYEAAHAQNPRKMLLKRPTMNPTLQITDQKVSLTTRFRYVLIMVLNRFRLLGFAGVGPGLKVASQE